MRLRTANNRLKVEHSIIEGLRRVLEDLLAATPAIQSIIPGRIRKVRDARGPVRIRVTTPTRTGWKGIALAGGARRSVAAAVGFRWGVAAAILVVVGAAHVIAAAVAQQLAAHLDQSFGATGAVEAGRFGLGWRCGSRCGVVRLIFLHGRGGLSGRDFTLDDGPILSSYAS